MALQEPSRAFVGASWTALAVGTITYLLGLWNAQLALSEKGYYLVCLQPFPCKKQCEIDSNKYR